jgi:hypothetical protein
MANQQCDSCGGFHDINSCQTCHTLICARCSTNHEQGCGQAADMKRKGQGPTIHQADVVVVSRPNPVESVNDKIVTDGPIGYVGVENSVPPVENTEAAAISVETPSAEIVEPVQEDPNPEAIGGETTAPIPAPVVEIVDTQRQEIAALLGEPLERVHTLSITPDEAMKIMAEQIKDIADQTGPIGE